MEKHAAQDAVILIPSLEPDDRLPAYIRRLKEGGFAHIVVVDDGSGEAYRPIFDSVDAVEDTVVLRHEVNKGKGVALKTGYRYIEENLSLEHCADVMRRRMEEILAWMEKYLKV